MKAQHDMSPSSLASLKYSSIFLSLAFGITSLERGGEFHATVLACFLVVPHAVCDDKPLVDLVHSWVLWVLSTRPSMCAPQSDMLSTDMYEAAMAGVDQG